MYVIVILCNINVVFRHSVWYKYSKWPVYSRVWTVTFEWNEYDVDIWHSGSGWLPFLILSQQCQSTAGNQTKDHNQGKSFTGLNFSWSSLGLLSKEALLHLCHLSSANTVDSHGDLIYKAESVSSLFPETDHISQRILKKFGMSHPSIPKMVMGMACFISN